MSYLVLARKYRPQSFEEVVGQNPVSQTLLNALESGRVAHAYIFSGPRGVGKTTTARILAKCLNCEKGPTKTPCNKCDACRSISQSNSTDDVLEIDGASNRGIEQIRELRESAKYAPARSRYRIYIIDEAHQITKDAFGALLKTLEEPPAHVVFMMATTEVQKIPAPILSRCQRFSLRPISPELVFKHLKDICQQEKVKVDDDALADIVRFVEGSLRDALSLLDQALVFAPKGITTRTVRDLLGLLPMETIQGFASVIHAGEPGAILRHLSESIQNGIDLTQLGKDLQNYYHSLLLAKAGVEDAFKVDSTNLKQAAEDTDFLTLERNIRLLSRALDEMRHSDTPRAIFEVYALRLGQKTVDGRALIERLEKLPSAPSAAAPAPASTFQARPATSSFAAPSAPSSSFVRDARSPAIPVPPPAPKPPVPAVESPAPTVETESPAASIPSGRWSEFVAEIAQKKGPVAAALDQAMVNITGSAVVLTFNRAFHQDIATRSLDLLTSTFAKKFGQNLPFDIRLDRTSSPPPSSGDAGNPAPILHPAESRAINAQDAEAFEEVPATDVSPEAKKALKHFPGTVKRERKG